MTTIALVYCQTALIAEFHYIQREKRNKVSNYPLTLTMIECTETFRVKSDIGIKMNSR